MFNHIIIGDTVTRNFCGMIQKWIVSEVTDKLIVCGLGWSFCRNCGAEVDEDMNWNCTKTGSFLVRSQ